MRQTLRVFFWLLALGLLPTLHVFADDVTPDDNKPKVAVFPISGTASQDLRDHSNFALRAKLNRDATYQAISGPEMLDAVADAKAPINFDTSPDVLKDLASTLSPAILIWGDLNADNGGLGTLRLKILDLRVKDAQPRQYIKAIHEETEFRFAYEEALKLLPGVKDFEHPDEQDVHHDALSDALWKTNPNLVVAGDFSKEGHWEGLYTDRAWQAKFSDSLPGVDDVVILRNQKDNDSDKPHNVLAMNLSNDCATNNGMACVSDPIRIEQGVKYRITFKYKSDGPSQHVFVKGYVMAKAINGKPELREIYRRQVSPSGSTNGQWITIESDMNPQHVVFPVQYLKIDLYTYLTPGSAMFADVQLKAVGKQSGKDVMKDDAIKIPLDATRPSQ